ncbi:MAG: 1-acyl-sn-glycerol-3-phosphate acyltransferase [Tannerella sp.]|jgi:hypothetical protein|nr:1-acyl-sn-glycerol-3-phosphate acyltransferase [Tannerella sp.]
MQLFEDIRPYNESEIPPAMRRMAGCEMFDTLSQYIFPDEDVENVRKMVLNISTVDDFQRKVMYPLNRLIIDTSVEKLEYNGIEYLEHDKRYLYVSNHRDIMLDSSLFQFIIYNNGFRTTEITFGSNLMHSQLAVDIGKANKMFKVIRSCNSREFLYNAMILSKYIRHTIMEKGESVWIAQRNGRTKDGNDMTDQGIIKMFCMSDTLDLKRSLSDLNIVPLSVSYEIEPCDFLKTRELYLSLGRKKYVKQPLEDLNSIITGIQQQKGKVNINICKPITSEELDFKYNVPNEYYKKVASLIDGRIYENYKLYNNNYIAHDILAGDTKYSEHYTAKERERFVERCHQMLHQVEGEKDVLMKIFLGIYARPADNKIRNTN